MTVSRLLVLNYAMDSQHPVFPHQLSVVRDLSDFWDEVIVITCQERSSETKMLPKNITVYDLNWQNNRLPISIFKLIYIFLWLLLLKGRFVLFSYMTETLSAILAPLTKILRIRHVLWYAHTSNPKRLTWCHLWVNAIVTSTPESCPVKSKKVLPIGQSVDQSKFECSERQIQRTKKKVQVIHVGRLDPSKNIITLIRVFVDNFNSSDDQLHLVGSATRDNQDYLQKIKNEIAHQGLESRVILHGEKNQEEIRRLLCESDLFLHAYVGSLDKTLVEAIFSRIFVISYNWNFFKVFGTLTGEPTDVSIEEFFRRELISYKNLSVKELNSFVQSRYTIALNNHSRSQWLQKLDRILDND